MSELKNQGYWVDGYVFNSKKEYVKVYLEKDLIKAIKDYESCLTAKDHTDTGKWLSKYFREIFKLKSDKAGVEK